jgi:hypothetical protein
LEGERVRRLAEAKSYLQKRIEELEGEVELLKLLLSLVDAALSRESFTRAAELPREAPPAPPQAPPEEAKEVDLGSRVSEHAVTSRDGKELARVVVYERGLVIKPLIDLPADSPPLRSFFVAKILEGYKRKDGEMVEAGELAEEEAFDYEVVEEGGLVKEIRVVNYRERRRLDEIRSALRWTLQRVLERMGGG